MKSKTVILSGQPTDRLLQAKFHPQIAGIEYNTRNNEYNTRNNAYIKSIYEFLQTNSNSGSNNIRANGGY